MLAAVVAVALVSADAATYSSLRSFLIDQADSTLNTAHMPIEQQLTQVGPSPGQNGEGGGGPPIHTCGNCYVAVRGSTGTDVLQQLFLPNGKQASPTLPARITGFSERSDPREPTTYFDAPSTGGGPTFRVRASILGAGSSNGDTLLVAMPISDVDHTLHRLLLIEMVVTAAALAAVGLGAWWLVRLGLRPLNSIERTAEAIAAGDLSERVAAGSPRTEVGRLGRALNAMLERIESAFAARDRTETELRRSEARMRRFVADASHELRTPLAAVSAYAELFDRGARSSPDDLERVMSGIRGESTRMGRLVEDLMLLARMDEGPELQLTDVDLVSVAADAVQAATAVGPEWPVVFQASEPLNVRADRTRVRQVFDNLLSNVRSHTPTGTDVTVTLSRDGNDAMAVVSDAGPGIPGADTGRVFERFYRADPSRSRASGGAGLGLSIVEAIVSAHGGRVELEAREGEGTTIRFWIPLVDQ